MHFKVARASRGVSPALLFLRRSASEGWPRLLVVLTGIGSRYGFDF